MILSLLLITLYSLIAYALLIPFLGFYSEDFFFAYVGHFYGPEGLIKSLSIDRPFNGYVLSFFYFLLQDNIFLWHLSTFLIRLFGGYVLFFSLYRIWPEKLSLVTLISLISLLYPGFLQQTLPLGYQIHVISLTFWIISFAFTIFAIKSGEGPKLFFYTLLAMIFQIITFLNLEFFVGLEIFRLIIIVLILGKEISFSAIKKTVSYWSPYLLTVMLFILWRTIIFKSTRPETDINWVLQSYYSNPLWISKILLEMFLSFLHTVIFAYFLPFIINFVRLPLWNSLVSLGIGFGSAALVFNFFKGKQLYNQDKKLAKYFFLIGLISLIGTLLPLILSGRFVRIYAVYDRYTMVSTIAVSFLITGFLLHYFKTKIRLIVFLLVAVSLTAHLMNGFYRADYWNKQKNLWWQLYWRAPGIEKNTMLILDFPKVTKDIPFKNIINKFEWYRFYWAEEQIWSAGNLFFNYSNPYSNHFYGDFLADNNTLEKIKKGSVEIFNNRGIIYTRDFKKSIIITVPSDTSCLRVLEGNVFIKKVVAFPPPKQIFGSEPTHDWCYFFQKASLARQFQDWDQLSQLKKEVIKKNLKPKDPNEWLLFSQDLR